MNELTDDYKKYLQSSRWKAIRKQKLIEANNCCELCGRSGDEYRLNVHHNIYPDELGTELLNDLTVVCYLCHRDLHRVRI